MGDLVDMYAFCMFSLCNVALIGSYGYLGAYVDLCEFLVVHFDLVVVLEAYILDLVFLFDLLVDDSCGLSDSALIVVAVMVVLVMGDDAAVDVLLVFLDSLTDFNVQVGVLGIFDVVPSGLMVVRMFEG